MRLDAREGGGGGRAAEALYVNAKLAYERAVSLRQQKFVSPAASTVPRPISTPRRPAQCRGANQSHAAIVAPISGRGGPPPRRTGEMAPRPAASTIYEPGGLRVSALVPRYRLAALRSVKAATVEFPELGRWVEG